MNTFIQQVCIQLFQSDSRGIYVMKKDFYIIESLLI